jgi:hypothetical protein
LKIIQNIKYFNKQNNMKKNVLLMLPLLLMGLITTAQITVTNNAFPSVGQAFQTNIVNGLQRIDITPAGPNQVWDMADLLGTPVDFTVAAAASGAAAANFPTATLIIPELGGVAGDAYVKVSGNQMETVGLLATIDGLISNFPVKLTPNRIDLVTPMNYQNTSSSAFDLQVALDPHIPAGTALDSTITTLEVPGVVTIDSLRITFIATRTTEVDAWGSLTIPVGAFDVLRLRTVDYTNTILEVKVTFFGVPNNLWQNLSDPNNVLNVDPATLPFGGLDTIITYEFWDADEQQAVLKVLTGADGQTATSGQYRRGTTSTKGQVLTNGKAAAYPNPATDNFTLELTNFDAGDYTFKMYNILGKEVKNVPFRYSGDTKMLIQTDNLNAGTYIYRILNDNNEHLITRKMIIVQP